MEGQDVLKMVESIENDKEEKKRKGKRNASEQISTR